MRLLLSFALALSLALSGCSKDSTEDKVDVAQVLAEATEQLNQTSGLRLAISSEDFPSEVRGLVSAEGVIVKPASFDGTLTIRIGGADFPVPVIGVGETVLAQIPLTEGWSDVEPADYGAPDPTKLLDPQVGFGALLPASTELQAGESVRGGANNDEVLTTYRGVVPGAQMKKVIPSATDTEFDANYQLSDDNQLRSATFTGVFYPDSEPITYTVTFAEYDLEQAIVLPPTPTAKATP